jgi:hypothetical protein
MAEGKKVNEIKSIVIENQNHPSKKSKHQSPPACASLRARARAFSSRCAKLEREKRYHQNRKIKIKVSKCVKNPNKGK